MTMHAKEIFKNFIKQKIMPLFPDKFNYSVISFIINWKNKLTFYYKKMWGFRWNFYKKKNSLAGSRFTCDWKDRWPCLNETVPQLGFDPHYVYHTSWAARILANTKPEKHVDISSDLRFVTLASAFVPIDFYDYRPAKVTLSGLNSSHADVTNLQFPDASVPSLSCMHVVEHIGLERYGDPFDPQGDLTAMKELQRVLSPGGNLMFAVPVGGKARIQYNAHRIYTFSMIKETFSGLKLLDFSLVQDDGTFIEHATEDQANTQIYGCGCWHFVKEC